MPRYEIETLEKFVVKCIYRLDADDPEEAVEAIQNGLVAYEDKEIQDGDEEFIGVVSIETLEE